jgi:hypothetical protein
MQFVAFTVSIDSTAGDGTSKVGIEQTGRKWTGYNGDQAACLNDLADAAVVRTKYTDTDNAGTGSNYKIDKLHACVVTGETCA